MADAYDSLVRSGFVGSLKRDVLLEAVRDLEYLSAIQDQFSEAGDAARREARACTARLVQDLTSKGFCSVATWSDRGDRQRVLLHPDRDELLALIDAVSGRNYPFAYFLVATEAGAAWVKRYFTLESEL